MSSRLSVLALAGDFLIQHRVSRYTDPGFLALVKLLRQADATVVNLETNISSGEDSPAYIAGQGGFASPYMAAPPWIITVAPCPCAISRTMARPSPQPSGEPPTMR